MMTMVAKIGGDGQYDVGDGDDGSDGGDGDGGDDGGGDGANLSL